MRTLVKLLVAGLVIHGAWRVGSSYWTYYKFHDAVTEAVRFTIDLSEPEVHGRVMDIASELRLPLTPERLSIRREKDHTIVNATYVEPIEVLPRFHYPWEFKLALNVLTLRAPKAGDSFLPQ